MASENSTADTVSTKLYTRAEVLKHNESNDLWLIIHNKVYDVTSFLDKVFNHVFIYIYIIYLSIFYNLLVKFV